MFANSILYGHIFGIHWNCSELFSREKQAWMWQFDAVTCARLSTVVATIWKCCFIEGSTPFDNPSVSYRWHSLQVSISKNSMNQSFQKKKTTYEKWSQGFRHLFVTNILTNFNMYFGNTKNWSTDNVLLFQNWASLVYLQCCVFK